MSDLTEQRVGGLTELLTAFTVDIVHSRDDAETVVDRYHTPDVVQFSDGRRFEREQLVAHVHPVRKNLVDFEIEVHDSVRDGDRVAARYTLHAEMRRGRRVRTEIHAFADFAEDGRLRRVHQLTRDVSESA